LFSQELEENLIFWPPTFGIKSWRLRTQLFLFGLLWNPQVRSSKVPCEVDKKKLLRPFMELSSKLLGRIHKRLSVKKFVRPLTFNIESWKLSAFLPWPIHKNSEKAKHKFFCIQPLLELPSSKFKSFGTCQT
jgi:hypothetical protein